MEEIQGRLWEGVLPGVLRTLFVGRKTGLLSFSRKDERRRVRFRGGNIVSADSSVREDWMGEQLVRRGRLSREDLKRAVGFMLRDKRRLGVVLMELGLLDAEGLEEAVAAHVKQVLSRVFSWDEGRYHFQEEPEDRRREGDVSLRLSTGELILEAARSVEDPDIVRFNLGDLDRVLAMSNDPLLRFQRISLSPADGYTLSRVDGSLTAREVARLTPLPDEQFHRSLFGLLSAGVVDFLPKAQVEPESGSAVAASGLSGPAEAGPQPVTSSPGFPMEATTVPPGEEALEESLAEERAGKAISDQRPAEEEPAEKEPVAEEPTEEEPVGETTGTAPAPGQSAVEQTIVLVAPGELFVDEPTEPLTPGESAVEQTMVMPSLRDLPLGRTMPMSFSELGDSAEPEPTDVEKTLNLPPVDTRRLEVLEAYENLRARTHFEVLGVPRDSTEAQLREAYFRHAKRFHPDVHHDPALSDLREELEEVFGRLGEAYEVLCSPRLRARYEKELDRREGAPETPAWSDPGEEAALAAEAIEQGEESIAQERYWEAIQKLEPAISRVQGEDRLHGRILLAQAYAVHPKWVKQGEELLLAALQDEPESHEALLLLARIYCGLGLRSRAETMLRRVLDGHPDHEEARGLMVEVEKAGPVSAGEAAARVKKLIQRRPG